jgi:hypothetical protein
MLSLWISDGKVLIKRQENGDAAAQNRLEAFGAARRPALTIESKT